MWKLLAVSATVLVLGIGAPAEADDIPVQTAVQTAAVPFLISSLGKVDIQTFCGEKVPLDTQDVKERLEKEFLLALWDRPQAILWLKRSHRYLPQITSRLREAGLPEDLQYVAVAESALRPNARSNKGAFGIWQFITGTAQRYGLLVNDHLDERRSVQASTEAAARYFSMLYKAFGSWTLAAAAYNMGEQGLSAEIREQGIRDFYRLDLPPETERFILRIVAIKMIMSNPEKYGFQLSEEDYYPPLRAEEVRVDFSRETPVRLIAAAAQTDFKVIKDLNPQVRGRYLPPGTYTMLVPEGASKDFKIRYISIIEADDQGGNRQVYVVKDGDNLSAIARKLRVPLPTLMTWNRIERGRPIHPGDRLTVFAEAPCVLPAAPAEGRESQAASEEASSTGSDPTSYWD